MAPKRTVRKRRSYGAKRPATINELLQRAEAEVSRLQRRARGGPIARGELNAQLSELDTELTEVRERLKRMLNHVIDIL